MKKLAYIFLFFILALARSGVSQACAVNASPAGMSDQDFPYVYEIGTEIVFSATGCGIPAGKAIWYAFGAVNPPDEQVIAHGALSIGLSAGTGVLEESRERSIGMRTAYDPDEPGAPMPVASLSIETGVKPAKPEITIGECGYSREYRTNVVRVQIGPDDNDPLDSSSMMYSVKRDSEIIGWENANDSNGRFDYDIALPVGESSLTAQSHRLYRHSLDSDFGNYIINSAESNSVTVSCPDIPLDDITDDGNPDNCPSCKAARGHPVNVSSGKMWHRQKEFTLPGRTEDTSLTFQRTYLASTQESSGDLGYHWVHNFESHLKFIPRARGQAAVIWFDESGGGSFFDYQGSGIFLSPGGQKNVLKFVTDHYELKKPDSTVYFYSASGKLTKIRDRHGEEQTLTYTSGKLSSVSAPFAGTIDFTRDDAGRIITVTRVRDGLSY